jgi:hypothetical protein
MQPNCGACPSALCGFPQGTVRRGGHRARGSPDNLQRRLCPTSRHQHVHIGLLITAAEWDLVYDIFRICAFGRRYRGLAWVWAARVADSGERGLVLITDLSKCITVSPDPTFVFMSGRAGRAEHGSVMKRTWWVCVCACVRVCGGNPSVSHYSVRVLFSYSISS